MGIDVSEMLAEYRMRFGSSKGFVDKLPHTTLETDLYRDIRVLAHRLAALEAVLACSKAYVNDTAGVTHLDLKTYVDLLNAIKTAEDTRG